MSITAKGTSLQALQNSVAKQCCTDISPTSGFFFTSPFRSLITAGCFTQVTQPAAEGGDLQGKFQQQVRQAFAEARVAGIKQPLLCGAIPFDTQQPSALFIPYESRCFDRAAFVAGLSPLATGPEIASIAEVPTQQSFMQMVSDAVVAMKTEQLDKVVLSRLLEIETCQPVDCHALMARVIVQNPHGFHFHVPLERGALLGASPELLLRQSNGRFYSNPLAGSARRVADAECDLVVGQQLMASKKDRHEHRIVTEGIRQVLASRSHYLNVPQFPELLTTTTLWHLSTPIDGEVASRDESALSLACLLHPTPALCGMPAAAAHALIKQLEPFDRGLFGGIVGWCDAVGNGEWVVTIRCGTVDGNQVRLFAGAGIVPGSSPESEWHETDTKLSTILRAFGLHQG
ncbi:isochorismate synthase [Serratia symbiotica]|uniref:isochorismate synthase n=1 Tax=Serratia symbiotica TaxID=138074 RepID=A0A068YVL2_9GAMM|nr:isochorismate synthase [Serratia symbiotica]MBF1996385.1 isochorismate synthase [Serratia symbiotica]MBQ0954847.1 isochorismate synthase [Serratia symbiotica]QLH63855.1 isochorismate synthase [Serratia symbiotica]QTP14297.1 isochorismate synthase [Serratia symbiotica]CDS55450.1 isochorismate synthase 1 [Serratia symbiotica]